MQNQNKSNSIQNSTISSIFPRLQSPPLLLPHSHLSHFPNPYQSIFFRPFVIQRPLVPPMNLFLSPLPFIRIRPITIPEREKKLISKLSIESIIGSTEVENRKNTSENKDIKSCNGSSNANGRSRNGEIIKELNKILILSRQKKERPKTSFEPTSEENAQIKASEACSSGAVEPNHGYACHRCGKLFSYAYYRDKHLKFTPCVDNGQRRFPCPHCLRSFEKRDRLRIHILHVHERRRPHVCQICKKAFSQSSSLSKHMRTHSGERPYKCPHCEKAFTASSILRTHIRQHSGEKPFKCTVCGKSFASHAAHDSHMRRSHQ
ncbi:hypothetical protein ACQ4LE_000400 [Meloidogyne hapla]